MPSPFIVRTLQGTSSAWWIGFLISFLGSLPPGPVNVLLIHIAGTNGLMASGSFAFGGVVAEWICVFLCLIILKKAIKFRLLLKTMQWLSMLMLLVLAYLSFTTRSGNAIITQDVLSHNGSPFALGFIMMTVNPVHFPFWLGWTTLLLERKVIAFDLPNELAYLSAIGAGSLAASALFIYLGRLLSQFLIDNDNVIHILLGTTCTIILLTQFLRMHKKK